MQLWEVTTLARVRLLSDVAIMMSTIFMQVASHHAHWLTK